jgi:hypothetical protein
MYVVCSKGNNIETKATPFQGNATMTYTRSHTRPSQKDLGCVVYPLNNKSLDEKHQIWRRILWSEVRIGWSGIPTNMSRIGEHCFYGNIYSLKSNSFLRKILYFIPTRHKFTVHSLRNRLLYTDLVLWCVIKKMIYNPSLFSKKNGEKIF